MSVLLTRRALFAVVALTLALSGRASASVVIFNTMPTNPAGTPETLLGRSIMNVITVGPSDVTITGFGTFGQILEDGNLQWVIFSNAVGSAPLFSTGPIATAAPGADVWNDSPEFSFTLLANTTYQLGVMADKRFTYNWDFPGTAVSQGGLTQPQGINGNAFEFANPVLGIGGSVVNSLRVFGGTAAVPEPSTLALAGLAGLIGAVHALRRRRRAA